MWIQFSVQSNGGKLVERKEFLNLQGNSEGMTDGESGRKKQFLESFQLLLLLFYS